MPLAAILSATAPCADRPDLPRAQIIFAAQTLVEYQGRQAIQAGATHLFIMVDAVTPVLSRLVDRLSGEGVQVYLIRDMPGLVRQLPRECDVLLFADGMIVDQKYVMELASAEGNALLVANDEATIAHFERVDGVHRWAGIARISPHTLFNTLDLIGDWDLVLTLLRAVVQSEPRRIVIAPSDVSDGRIALVDRQATADLVGRSLSVPLGAGGISAGAEHYILQPFARRVATQLLRMQVSAVHIAWGAIAAAGLGLLCAGLAWTVPALLLFLGSLAADLVGRSLAGVGHRVAPGDFARLAPVVLVSAGFLWLGANHGMASDGLYLGLLSLITAEIIRRRKPLVLPDWVFMTPGTAILLILIGTLFGKFGSALLLAVFLAIISLGAILLVDGSRERETA